MKIAPLVAQHVEEVAHGNWTDIFLDDTLADVSYAEAVALPAGITNSIAMLANHLGFYNNIAMARLKGENPVINDANGFDVMIKNEDEWNLLRAGTIESFKRLAAYVRQLPDEKIFSATPGRNYAFYKMLHGISEHAHYHLGQIVLLKKIIRHANA